MSPRRMGMLVVPPLASLFIRALRRTMRIRFVGGEALDGLRRSGRPYIHAFWHGHLLMMPYSYPGRRIGILISSHGDGELIARTMSRFGHETIRGSTTRGGASALRQAVRMLRAGGDVAFTPDGPKGPRHVVQPGVIEAARLGGAPIVPVGFSASPRRVLGSWDGFIVPYPFSRGVFVYGAPLTVPSRAGEAELERARRELEAALARTALEAEALASGRPIDAGETGERHA
ncbi:MAG TPA: lysophospholipid acyltransferase family protein [Candidatus Polarisedimenticolia bacterium]|nr:lysophospholipid acyltransferase family protein [Candidatus Polarisedimenticolia bacterium]